VINNSNANLKGGPFFCGALLPEGEMIRDNSFVSNVRSYLGKHIDLESFQSKMVENWKEELPHKQVMLADATASAVRML
jgi:transposase, IS5 family